MKLNKFLAAKVVAVGLFLYILVTSSAEVVLIGLGSLYLAMLLLHLVETKAERKDYLYQLTAFLVCVLMSMLVLGTINRVIAGILVVLATLPAIHTGSTKRMKGA